MPSVTRLPTPRVSPRADEREVENRTRSMGERGLGPRFRLGRRASGKDGVLLLF